jgi:hypothetical protein
LLVIADSAVDSQIGSVRLFVTAWKPVGSLYVNTFNEFLKLRWAYVEIVLKSTDAFKNAFVVLLLLLRCETKAFGRMAALRI